ncbi:hypothetical protein G6F24_018801 [Rhizopus arrhizus]|nr:hypothetical protein G6F24_018801 [Rhizopus arrhizus]
MGRLARFARILRAAAVIAVMQHPLGRERRPSHGEVSDRYRLPARWRWSAWAATIPAGSRIGTGLARIRCGPCPGRRHAESPRSALQSPPSGCPCGRSRRGR